MSKSHTVVFIVSIATLIFSISLTYPHCELPCGIYDDQRRFETIDEHIKTIEKSINKIDQLSKAENPNYNQIVRWVTNKENHAIEIQSIISRYFLAQRIKPVDKEKGEEYKKYIQQLTLAHEIITLAMKTKQSTDIQNVKKLRNKVEEFSSLYLENSGHQHE